MTMRIHCDHCGLQVTQFRKYGYGQLFIPYPYSPPQQVINTQGGFAAQSNQQSGANQQSGGFAPATSPVLDCPIAVDLCERCVPIWVERVGKLTLQNA